MGKGTSGENGVALYFPYLTFTDKSWLLGSLCLWESVRRILPAGVDADDPEWIKPLVGKGLVRRAETADSLIEARQRFAKVIRPSTNRKDPMDESDLPAALSRFVGSDERPCDYVAVAHAKLDNELWGVFHDAGMTRPGPGGFLEVVRPVAELYLTCLATAMGERSSMPLMTDSARFVDWSRTVGRPGIVSNAGGEPLVSQLAALQLEWPDTGAFESVDPTKFAAFHGKTFGARTTFRNLLLRMRDERAVAKSIEEDEDVVGRYRREFDVAYSEVTAKISELGVKKSGGVLALCSSIWADSAISEKLVRLNRDSAERRTAMSQMYKNPGYYAYLVNKARFK